MQPVPKTYRAVCFDLDGTLLPMDLELFMERYFGSIYAFAAEHGLDAKTFMTGLKAGTKAMATSDEGVTNADAFWNTMLEFVGGEEESWTKLLEEFYAGVFTTVGEGIVADPAAARAVRTLREKGYTLALTTMPMFPPIAVAERLRWANIDAADFARLTTYDNSKSAKPRQTYYAENLAALGVRGEDVLMVGNNTVEDLSFMDLGADAYLITDNLIDPIGYDLDSIKHGSMAEFAAWVETLPACQSPAVNVNAGVVATEDMERAFAENAVREIDREEGVRKAGNVIDDPTYERAKGGESKIDSFGTKAGFGEGAEGGVE